MKHLLLLLGVLAPDTRDPDASETKACGHAGHDLGRGWRVQPGALKTVGVSGEAVPGQKGCHPGGGGQSRSGTMARRTGRLTGRTEGGESQQLQDEDPSLPRPGELSPPQALWRLGVVLH